MLHAEAKTGGHARPRAALEPGIGPVQFWVLSLGYLGLGLEFGPSFMAQRPGLSFGLMALGFGFSVVFGSGRPSPHASLVIGFWAGLAGIRSQALIELDLPPFYS